MQLEAEFMGTLGSDTCVTRLGTYLENPTYQVSFRVRTGVFAQPLQGSRTDLKCSPASCEQAMFTRTCNSYTCLNRAQKNTF